MKKQAITLTVLFCTAFLGIDTPKTRAGDVVKICPAPEGEPLSTDFQVTVEGKPAAVYTARVSAVPFNYIWPGFPNVRCDRPLDQTEIASFASWDMSGPVHVEIQSDCPIRTVAVRPIACKVQPVVDGNRIVLTISNPGYFSVEVNGTAKALHLFANPPESEEIQPDAPATRYFGPGIHHPGVMHLRSGETLYIAGGAVVYGAVLVDEAENVRILGRGILDVSDLKRGQTPGAISLAGCRNVLMDGIIIRDTNRWAVVPTASQNVVIRGLKLIGFWRYNADGINVVNSQDVVIDHCFIRSFDDSVTMKGVDRKHPRFTELGRGLPIDELPVRNVTVSRCVIWNDWGQSLKIGSETSAPEIAEVTFKDCDLIHPCSSAIDIHLCGYAVVHDIRFEDIRIETHEDAIRPVVQKKLDAKAPYTLQRGHVPNLLKADIEKSFWGFTDKELGKIHGIHLKNISITGGPFPKSQLCGYDEKSDIENVTIEGLFYNDRPISSLEQVGLTIGNFVKDVKLLEETKR